EFVQIFRLMASSQLYKYIPGNFFHYVKRYEFFHRLDLKKYYLKVNSYELLLYVLSSLIFLPFIIFNSPLYIFIALIFLIFIFVVAPISKILKEIFIYYFFAHLLFMISFLFIFYFNKFNIKFYDYFYEGSVFTLSKTVGTLIPGAPAGLGFSEMFLFMAKFDYLVTSMLIYRVVILFSEILLFFVSIFYMKGAR
ncbi:hypothetical protein OAK42_00740, partial [Candidatus Poseidoniaceae archaeon]|nr:hypothetical protein [Candidatus Poseidoniaceae archaeon]